MGLGGIFGYLSWLVYALPEIVVVPILVFIGLEIGGQAFVAVPRRYIAAVAVCFLPVLADAVLILGNQLLSGAGLDASSLKGPIAGSWRALELLGAGFIFSAMLMGSALAFIIDRRLFAAAVTFLLAAIASLFGVIHSPLPHGAVFLPWAAVDTVSFSIAGGYLTVAIVVGLLGCLPAAQADPAA